MNTILSVSTVIKLSINTNTRMSSSEATTEAVPAATQQEDQKVEVAAVAAEDAVKENGDATAAEPVAEQPEKEAPKEMRAVVLTGFGGLKSVKILKKPEPALSEGEVLIRVKAW